MFEFFKDSLAELNGLDPKAMKEERRIKRELEKELPIIKGIYKFIILSICIIYFIIGTINIYSCFMNSFYLWIIKYVILIFLDLFIFISIALKNKKAEKFAMIAIFIFIVVNFIFARYNFS